MQFLNFTPQEIKALIFLLIALLVGSGITLYKRSHPQFAPELMREKSPQTTVYSPPLSDSLGGESVNKKINLNQATSEELEVIPGLGPILSQKIIAYREAHGPFRKLDDLMQISGIGPKKFEQIKDYLILE